MHIRCLPNTLEIFFECFMPTSRCKVPGLRYLGVSKVTATPN
jgi:hypothetical protein